MPRTVAWAIAACALNELAWLAWSVYGENSEPQSFDTPMDALIAAASTVPSLIELGLLWLMARRHNWARHAFAAWVLLCSTAVLAAATYLWSIDPAALGDLFGGTAEWCLTILSLAIPMAASALMYTEPASRWFARLRPQGHGPC